MGLWGGAAQAVRRPVSDEGGDMAMHLHTAAGRGDVAEVRRMVSAGADVNEQSELGWGPLHYAAVQGHVETVKVLAQLGAELGVQAANGETALQGSVRLGHHQMAEVLRELERTATRTQKAAATSARTRQPSRQDTPETREAAERIAAELIEEEEREQAAQRKVRPAPP
jgi:ankyrin repeat protein